MSLHTTWSLVTKATAQTPGGSDNVQIIFRSHSLFTSIFIVPHINKVPQQRFHISLNNPRLFSQEQYICIEYKLSRAYETHFVLTTKKKALNKDSIIQQKSHTSSTAFTSLLECF